MRRLRAARPLRRRENARSQLRRNADDEDALRAGRVGEVTASHHVGGNLMIASEAAFLRKVVHRSM